jgi:hypothetical protein
VEDALAHIAKRIKEAESSGADDLDRSAFYAPNESI